MRKSTRALVGLVVIDVALLGGAAWMVGQVTSGEWKTNVPPGEVITQITSTAGAVIGFISVLLGLVFVLQRRKGN